MGFFQTLTQNLKAASENAKSGDAGATGNVPSFRLGGRIAVKRNEFVHGRDRYPLGGARATVDGPIRIRKDGAALGGPTRITVPEAHAEFGERRLLNLGDAALVYTEFRCNVTVLPVEVKQKRDDSVFSL